MRTARSVLWLLILALAAAGTWPATGVLSAPGPEPRPASGKTPPLAPPLDALARCFRTGNPEHLRPLLPAKEKVHAISAALGLKSGYYGSDQIYFLLKDAFRSQTTRTFHFIRGTDFPPDARHLIAVARWTYRKGESGDLVAEITFDLVRHDGTWAVQEIREIR